MDIQDDTDCRFWGYEPRKPKGYFHGTFEERQAAVRLNRENHQKIKGAGLRPSRYGLKTKAAAIAAATLVEEKTGVEMTVFNHDFL